MKLDYRRMLVWPIVLAVVLLSVVPTAVYSQGTFCYFTSTTVNPPNGASVSAGQPVEIDTTFTVSCSYGGHYIIKAYLMDGRTSHIISTSSTTYETVGPYTATLTNEATAPDSLGWWSLQIVLNILAGGSPAAPQSQVTFGLTVVPYVSTATTTTAAMSTESSSVTTSSSLPTSSMTTSRTIETSSILATSESTGQYDPLPIRVAFVAIVAVIIGILIIKRRRRKKEVTRVY